MPLTPNISIWYVNKTGAAIGYWQWMCVLCEYKGTVLQKRDLALLDCKGCGRKWTRQTTMNYVSNDGISARLKLLLEE